jgi:tRNA threonylcarbamoyladenosine biosynthesis protein TsaE
MIESSLMGVHVIKDQEELSALASRVSLQLQPGDVVLLSGDLGAGKTTFTQCLGKALGVQGVINSPTYTLVGEYGATARPDISTLIHVDLYRTGDTSAPHASVLGDVYIEEIMAGAENRGAVVVIEWSELLKISPQNRTWRMTFELGKNEEERIITLSR